MSKKHVIEAYNRTHNTHFLFPEIDTISDFLEDWYVPGHSNPKGSLEPYRGDRPVDPLRDFYFLQGQHVEGQWTTIFAKAKRQYGIGIRSRCTNQAIGGFAVVKGGWPDPYALLMANDRLHIAQPFIALIDWEDYKAWVAEVLK